MDRLTSLLGARGMGGANSAPPGAVSENRLR